MVFERVAVMAVTAETVNPFQKLTQALLRALVPAPFVSSAKQVEGDGSGAGGGKQSSQPAAVTLWSVLHMIGSIPSGTTPSGELLPQ